MDKIININKDNILVGHDDSSVSSYPRESFMGKQPLVGMNIKIYRSNDGKEHLFPTSIDGTLIELLSFFIRTKILFYKQPLSVENIAESKPIQTLKMFLKVCLITGTIFLIIWTLLLVYHSFNGYHFPMSVSYRETVQGK